MAKAKEIDDATETLSQQQLTTPSSGRFKKYTIRLILLASLCGASYVLWKNPQFIEQLQNQFNQQDQTDPYAEHFHNLQNQISQLQNQLYKTNSKIENLGFLELKEHVKNLEKINLNIIDSKADVNTILGVITRMDAAEQKINNLSEVTDSSALLLTGILLVKDAADRGQKFEYEAEVLSQIAADNPQAFQQTQKLKNFAASGIPADIELAIEFEQAQTNFLSKKAPSSEQTWKERLNSKFNEIVQIKKLDQSAPQPSVYNDLKNAKKLIENGNILRAAELLQKTSDPELKNSEEIQNWIKKVNNREEFYQTISAMSAYALAALKVNNLQKVRNQ